MTNCDGTMDSSRTGSAHLRLYPRAAAGSGSGRGRARAGRRGAGGCRRPARLWRRWPPPTRTRWCIRLQLPAVAPRDPGRDPTGSRSRRAAASVLSRAVPIEPPICCEALTMPEATPLSFSGTTVAIAMDGATVNPKPTPIRINDGRTVGGVSRLDADAREEHQAEAGGEHPGRDERARADAGQQARAHDPRRWARSRSSAAETRVRSRAP